MEAFQDQSHIDQVRDALWASDGIGASVMVGSGFSQWAMKVRPDADEPPILVDLAEELHRRLYPRSGEVGCHASDFETIVPERIPSLAQEYRTAFGRASLHQLLQQMIRDDDLKPGEAHFRLLQLPWRDVFTTNWDTLLEQARLQVLDRRYSVVRDMDEIPFANKPRIVKLHGSLPVQFPLIFTEEDYRTYPTRFAPFVNTVQQAMMETVFCLIGFSGNDLNFLNWSGWVRDNLGASAPKIYLAGWLDLSHHRRRMLESRGIVPIDLARHPKAHQWPEYQRHHCATEWVLHTLERGRAYDSSYFYYWPSPSSQSPRPIPEHLEPVEEVTPRQPKKEPTRDPKGDRKESQERVKETLDIWTHNRHVYPGWLLLPAGEERETLQTDTNYWEDHILNILPTLTALEQLNAIFELVWRREILLDPVSEQLESAAEEALKSVDCQDRKINGIDEAGIDWSAIREVWRNVALALVTAARFHFDDRLFEKRIKPLEHFVNDHPDVHHRLRQEHCLWAMYSMDYEKLESLLEDWNISDCDPIWKTRKASLLWELDRNHEAAELVREALDEIRAIPDAEGSVASASREGWAMWSAFTRHNRQEFRRRWHELAALKCDAGLEKDLISRRVRGTGEPQEAPHFDLGVRRGESFRFSNERHDRAAYRALRLSEVAGLPPITNYNEPIGFTVAADILSSAADVLTSSQPELAIRIVLRVSSSETDNTLERVLSRTRVASLPSSTADIHSNICLNVVNYAFSRLVTVGRRQRSLFWITRMRVATEVLSRLVLRATHERAEEFLDIGLQCYESHEVAQEFWLHSAVNNLLRRTWEALPKDRRTARALDLLDLPIVGMDNFSADVAEHFLDPGELLQSEDLPSERAIENESRWHDAINFLIRGLEGDEEARNRALSRILMVLNKELLTETELSMVAQALWSDRYTVPDNLPGGTHLFDWAFLFLPEPDSGMAEQRFRLKWLSSDIDKFQNSMQSDTKTVSVALGTQPVDPTKIEDVFWNVGSAISMSRKHGRSFQLNDHERKYLVDLVELWANSDIPSYPLPLFQAAAREPTRRALQGMASILAVVAIPISVGERLYEKLKRATESGTPGFKLIHGLVKTIPDRFDELVTWLRMGMASDDESHAESAMSGLYSWLTASIDAEETLQPPPEDLLHEVGLMIATRRRVVLPQALQVATWVFGEGTQGQRQVMYSLTTYGLKYLAEELRYDRERSPGESSDQPLLRLLCVQLARTMAQSGFKDDPTVDRWLKLGEEDPLPEVRYAATLPGDNGEAEP